MVVAAPPFTVVVAAAFTVVVAAAFTVVVAGDADVVDLETDDVVTEDVVAVVDVAADDEDDVVGTVTAKGHWPLTLAHATEKAATTPPPQVEPDPDPVVELQS